MFTPTVYCSGRSAVVSLMNREAGVSAQLMQEHQHPMAIPLESILGLTWEFLKLAAPRGSVFKWKNQAKEALPAVLLHGQQREN
jgi:hypothetical protein